MLHSRSCSASLIFSAMMPNRTCTCSNSVLRPESSAADLCRSLCSFAPCIVDSAIFLHFTLTVACVCSCSTPSTPSRSRSSFSLCGSISCSFSLCSTHFSFTFSKRSVTFAEFICVQKADRNEERMPCNVASKSLSPLFCRLLLPGPTLAPAGFSDSSPLSSLPRCTRTNAATATAWRKGGDSLGRLHHS